MSKVPTVELEDIHPYRYFLHRIRTHKGWSFPRHRHARVFEFYYLFEGSLVQVFDNEEIRMEPGDLLQIKEEEFHRLYGKVFGFYILILPVQDWDLFLSHPELGEAYARLEGEKRLNLNISARMRAQVMNSLDELFLYQKSSYGDLLLQKFFINLISDLLPPPELHPVQTLPSWLESLLVLSSDRLDKGLNSSEMAEIADRTPEHLARSFKRYLQTTPSSWLNEQKMKRACLLLEHSNTPVLDIALSLGYENLNYFYKLFTGLYGMPPGEYRRSRSRLLLD